MADNSQSDTGLNQGLNAASGADGMAAVGDNDTFTQPVASGSIAQTTPLRRTGLLKPKTTSLKKSKCKMKRAVTQKEADEKFVVMMATLVAKRKSVRLLEESQIRREEERLRREEQRWEAGREERERRHERWNTYIRGLEESVERRDRERREWEEERERRERNGEPSQQQLQTSQYREGSQQQLLLMLLAMMHWYRW